MTLNALETSLFPKCLEFAKRQWSFHWTADEISLQHDLTKYQAFNSSQRELLLFIFTTFTQMDIVVGGVYNQHILKLFSKHFGHDNLKDLEFMTSAFSNMENIHVDAYTKLIDSLLINKSIYLNWKSNKKIHTIIEEIESLFETQNKYEVTVTIIERLLKFILFHEGVFLFVQFGLLYAYLNDGLLHASNNIIMFSMRDESLHVEGVIYLIRRLCSILNVDVSTFIQKIEKDILYKIGLIKETYIDEFQKLNKSQLTPGILHFIDNFEGYVDWLLKVRYGQLGINTDSLGECPVIFLRSKLTPQGTIRSEERDFLTEESLYRSFDFGNARLIFEEL